MTPNAARMRAMIEERWPGLRYSIRNCRHIGRDPTRNWSQHSEANALDIFGPVAALDQVAQWLLQLKVGDEGRRSKQWGYGIWHILWRGRSLWTGNPVADHYDHIHVDFAPWMKNNPNYIPPCKGGQLVVVYPNGTRIDFWPLWPEEGSEIPEPPDPPDTPEEEFMSTAELQEALNEAGVTDYEGKALKVDDAYGPRTKSALVKAFKGESGDFLEDGELVVLKKPESP